MWKIVIGLTALLATGCGQVDLQDVSNEEPYSAIVGSVVVTVAPTILHAVSLEPTKKEVDYYILTEAPGFSGREVLRREKVSEGARFKIVRVMRPTSAMMDRTVYVIEPVGDTTFSLPIRLQPQSSNLAENLGLPADVFSILN